MSDINEELQRIELNELRKAYRDTFASPQGKRVLFDILEMCGTYSAAFTGENNATNFRLGLQEGGKRLISRLDEIDARFYPTLLLAIADMKELDKAAASANKEQEDDDIDA